MRKESCQALKRLFASIFLRLLCFPEAAEGGGSGEINPGKS
jgi:hypothetical protein